MTDEQLNALYERLVVNHQPPIPLPTADWAPAQANPDYRIQARTAGQEILSDPAPRFGVLIVAGGTGSGLKFPHAKGLFPGTPLSGTPLYAALIGKIWAAARAFGQSQLFPTIFMTGPETEQETVEFLEKNAYFGARDRIRIARQSVLPVLDRRPGHEGLRVRRPDGSRVVGGAGHGDAFDDVLRSGSPAREWLEELGVRYVQFLNVDNLLNPVADPWFVGEHALSEQPAVPGRAHISVILVPKLSSRMGNIIEYRDFQGRRIQESIDYGLIPEVDERCRLGHVSIQIVTLRSLDGAPPIPFTVAAKETRVDGEWIPVWKFERSANNKARYGALLLRPAEEVFASIKRPDGESDAETPATAAQWQSEHWRRLLARAGDSAGRGYEVPASARIELPWQADYMPSGVLAAQLDQAGFPHRLQPERGYWVLPGLREFRELCLTRTCRSQDQERLGRLVQEFHTRFQREPDVVSRAPGRHTLLGDHQDYPPLPQDGSASSLTLAWASQRSVLVAGRRRQDRAIKCHALNWDQTFTISLDDLDGLAHEAAAGRLSDVYGQTLFPWARQLLAFLYSAARGHAGWRNELPLFGADLAIEGNVPVGAGQSSSAAYLVALTLACNDLFEWGIDRSVLTLADLARGGEHDEYSPFIRSGRCGYLDQIVSLTAREDQAVLVDHGDYRRQEWVSLKALRDRGLAVRVVESGLTRSLGETEYVQRERELSRLPAVLNRLAAEHDPAWAPRVHVHQFPLELWRKVRSQLEAEDAVLARRARYLFEENERTREAVRLLRDGQGEALLRLIDHSGAAMAMDGLFQISGLNVTPLQAAPFPALDELRAVLKSAAGSKPVAARLMGGGGGGSLCVVTSEELASDPGWAERAAREWRERTGLELKITEDPPGPGAEILWRQSAASAVSVAPGRRLETRRQALGDAVWRLVDESKGMVLEILPERAQIRRVGVLWDDAEMDAIFNPDPEPCGAHSWHVDSDHSGVDAAGVSLRLWTGDPAARRWVKYRLEGSCISVAAHLAGHAWPLHIVLDRKKNEFAEWGANGDIARLGGQAFQRTWQGADCPKVVAVKDWFRDLWIELYTREGVSRVGISYQPEEASELRLSPQTDAEASCQWEIHLAPLSLRHSPSPYSLPPARRAPLPERFPRLRNAGFEQGPLSRPMRTRTHKDAFRVFFAGQWHIYGTGHELLARRPSRETRRPQRRSVLFHLSSPHLDGPYLEQPPVVLVGDHPPGIYEAPSLIVEGDALHLFAQTTYYRCGGSIERFTSTNGHSFSWSGTALRSMPGTSQAGVYDGDIARLPLPVNGPVVPALVYSGFSRDGSRDDRPDPCLFVSFGADSSLDSFKNAERPLLTDRDVPWHNPHDAANPYFEWGLEGGQLMPWKNGGYLLLAVGFMRRPGRAYQASQRLFFASFDEHLSLLDVSDPILPVAPGWDEYGHGHMMIDPARPGLLRLLFQARPANEDKRFRDSDSWRLFEATFDV